MLISKLDGKNGAVLNRIVQAYGFKQKSQYADQVGLSSSNLAMRYKRDAFPADLVVQCLLDTDASLNWLITGLGEPPSNVNRENLKKSSAVSDLGENINLERLTIDKGELKNNGELVFDSRFLADSLSSQSDLVVIQSGKTQYIVDRNYKAIVDGKWVIDVEDSVSVKTLSRIPVGRVKVTSADSEFECALSDITVLGFVVMVCE
ncbi:phage repressor protein CI [Duffyella gerundensis]|uniref:phage repressor protein CI n=1 Tax=Duffyella gerundensis TaxID=1619313 RepID=UPI001654AACE|nr:phage repressor protein CI [Duffyella gerundensis]